MVVSVIEEVSCGREDGVRGVLEPKYIPPAYILRVPSPLSPEPEAKSGGKGGGTESLPDSPGENIVTPFVILATGAI